MKGCNHTPQCDWIQNREVTARTKVANRNSHFQSNFSKHNHGFLNHEEICFISHFCKMIKLKRIRLTFERNWCPIFPCRCFAECRGIAIVSCILFLRTVWSAIVNALHQTTSRAPEKSRLIFLFPMWSQFEWINFSIIGHYEITDSIKSSNSVSSRKGMAKE
jgi:hypothetical protein